MSITRGALRGFVWFVLAGATLEVCARLDDWLTYGAPLLEPYNSSRMYMKDQLGVRGRPGASYLKWTLNELGFRGPDLKAGGLRIICIGSSETFGLYEAKNHEYPRQLEGELNRRLGFDGVQVANVAYPGMSISATVRRLPEVIKMVQPRIATIYPSFSSYIDLQELAPPSNPGQQPVSSQLSFEFRMQSRLETLAKQIIPERLQTELRLWQIRQAERLRPAMDRVPEENVRRFRSDLASLVDALRSHGVTAVLMTHATRFGKEVKDDQRPMLIAWRKFYPLLKEEGFLDMEQRMNAVVREIGATYSLPVIDIAEELAPGATNFVEFVHFTDTGARSMANISADHLLPVVRQQLSSNGEVPPRTRLNMFSRDDNQVTLSGRTW